jgi:hypothetical protein
MATNGRRFLADVLDAFEEHGEAHCPAGIADMMPYAAEDDMERHAYTYADNGHDFFLSPDPLVATLLAPSNDGDSNGDGLPEIQGALDAQENTRDDGLSPRELAAAASLIHPDSTGKMAWDVTVSLVILYSVITITYQLGFDYVFTGTLANIDLVVDLIFVFDILVTFNTAAVDSDENLVVSRGAICKMYLRGWFGIDFVSTFPIDRVVLALTSGGGNPALLRSVKLIRAVRLARLFKII